MSDAPQGDGWWMANDGKWYPPQLHPDDQQRLPPPPTPPEPGWWMASDGQWYPPTAVPGSPPVAMPGDEGPVIVGDAGRSAKERAASLRRRADNWDSGGDGEAVTGRQLELLPAGYHVLHDLHVPGSTANIDHLVVGQSGVWLIDTKTTSASLRLSGGTLWRGRYSMRKELAAVERHAGAVADVLKVNVTPVLSFVDASIPPGTEALAPVRVTTSAQLPSMVTAGTGHRVDDVDSVARLARTLRTPTPPVASASAAPKSKGRTNPAGPPAQRRPRRGRRLIGAIAKLGVVGVVLLLVLGAIGAAGNALTALIPTTTTVAPPPLDGETIDVPSPAVGAGFVCVRHGEGWQASVNWPFAVDPQHAPAALDLTTLVKDGEVNSYLWTKGDPSPEVITGVGPNTEVAVVAQGILSNGTRLTPTTTLRTSPDRDC